MNARYEDEKEGFRYHDSFLGLECSGHEVRDVGQVIELLWKEEGGARVVAGCRWQVGTF